MMLHWTKLKKAVEEAGGTWTTREEAEAFLASVGQDVVATQIEPKASVAFDPSRPYSEVIGSDPRFPGAAYGQGGHYFNKQGKKVG